MKLFSFINVLVLSILSYIKSIETENITQYKEIKRYYREKGANFAFTLCIYYIPSPFCYEIIEHIEKEIKNEIYIEVHPNIVGGQLPEDTNVNIEKIIKETIRKNIEILNNLYKMKDQVYFEQCPKYFNRTFCGDAYKELQNFENKRNNLKK